MSVRRALVLAALALARTSGLALAPHGLGLRPRPPTIVMEQPKDRPDQTGMDGTRNWYNEGGERSSWSKAKKKAPTIKVSSLLNDPLASLGAWKDADGNDEGLLDSPTRRWVLGIGGAAALLPLYLRGMFSLSERNERRALGQSSALDGDAVSRPALEEKLEEVVRAPPSAEQRETIANLVNVLEEQRGSQLAAASRRGKWVVPWVGGWERLTASGPDASFIGGPPSEAYRGMQLVSARQFVYGPGVGGMISEYLYAPRGGAAANVSKLLLSRGGELDNLGGNFFSIGFDTDLQAYEVGSVDGEDALATGTGAAERQGGGAGGGPASVTLRTSYLSSTMWIVKQVVDGAEGRGRGQGAESFAVFQRTDTRSVMDQRGLVADGQLNPSADETIRYGRLLFGESLSDYAGWDRAAKGSAADLAR